MKTRCTLCPKYCLIAPGQSGNCRVRINVDGELKTVVFNHPVSIHLDPIEKKPLFHFLPGSKILSLATAGCNLHCKNCQNWEISQVNPEDIDAYHMPVPKLIQAAKNVNSVSLAYTYTDPFAFYEYTYESAMAAREQGIKNVLVTAGYLNRDPLKRLCKYVDAANIDLKAFSNQFYVDVCDATLKPVLDTIVLAKEMGVHVEITNLIIPTLNDSKRMIKDLVKWVYRNVGADVPLHFSRFYPQYKMRNLPPTPSKTLISAREMAMDMGMHYVYIGNLHTKEGENTYCPRCKRMVIERSGYTIRENVIDNNRCPYCGRTIEGVWTDGAL